MAYYSFLPKEEELRQIIREEGVRLRTKPDSLRNLVPLSILTRVVKPYAVKEVYRYSTKRFFYYLLRTDTAEYLLRRARHPLQAKIISV